MTLQVMLIHNVEILKPTKAISNAGDEYWSWANPSRTASKAWINPERTDESEDPLRDGTQLKTQIFLGPAVFIENQDRIEWEGRVFEVIGKPIQRYTTRGLHHLEVLTVELEG